MPLNRVRMALVVRNYAGGSGRNAWVAYRSESPSGTETTMSFFGYFQTVGAAQTAIKQSMPGLNIRFSQEDQAGSIEAYAGYGAWVS